jgi:predicted transcriptional regulator
MAYSTVLTMMRILREKGFLRSERQGKADLYSPTISREDAGRRSLGEVIESFFSGSAEALVSQLLNNQSLSDEELKSIRSELNKTLKSREGNKK